ncbi:endospore germination permease [Paenibacillus sp. GCM10023248]|uniref:GerAB/ArcD/ProY family transporter n=1 Tax=unclassified Paenibacillus TaxID=185978 RepID=UPI00237801BF|nr:endospore germination permease [Paenibacillus sp. MAHUQ-63]MDD9268961.1 endospore germination permease [Paenibacillus sp. MAHUQ-63]
MNKETITPRQFMIIVILFSIGTSILVIPASVAADARQDAWMPQLFSIAAGSILVALYAWIATQYPATSIYGINDRVFGKWPGRLLTLCISLLCLLFGAQDVFYVGHFLVTQIMPTTPIQAINVLFMAVVVLGAKSGIVVFLRTAEIFFPWIVLLFILFMTMNVPNMELNNLLPVWEIPPLPIARSVFRITSFTYVTLFIAIGPLIHQVTSVHKVKAGYFAGVVISGIMMVLLVLSSILVLGADSTAMQKFPSYALAQHINIGHFLQRIEVVVAFLWLVSIYFKMSMFFYATIKGLGHVLQMRDYKTLSVPIGLIVTVISFIVYPSNAYEQRWDNQTYLPLALLIGVVYPVAIVLFGKLRKQLPLANKEPVGE